MTQATPPRQKSAPPRSDKALRKYLAQHCEPEAAEALATAPAARRYGHVLCIPAHGEGEALCDALASIPAGPLGPVLTIVVVNETEASPDWVRAANRASLDALGTPNSAEAGVPARLRWRPHPRGDLLCIDRTQSAVPLPPDQGVGLARKIAADAALALWADGRVASPWIHCSDADVRFPDDYFARPLLAATEASEIAAASACVYDFSHLPDPDPATTDAALHYEIFLRYYVLGLRSAGSAYAFHTIGSTLALAPLAYARARGFPRRAAAEDFHLLAKLAKLGSIQPLRGAPLLLSGRVSTRVPFGTGAGIARELARREAGAFYPAYDPQIFTWLGVWLRTLDLLGSETAASGRTLRDCLGECSASAANVDADLLYEVLTELGASQAAEAGRTRGRRHLHERFDALRTLRFVHQLRDRRFPGIPLEAALRAADFVDLPANPDLVATRDALTRCESLDANTQTHARG